MSKPVTLPLWATDTNLATGSESGLSTKLEPSTGVKQQGSVPGEEAPGRWYNWLLNNIYTWCVYLDGLATDAQFLANNFAFTGTHSLANDSTFAVAKTRTKYAALNAGAGWTLGGDGSLNDVLAVAGAINIRLPIPEGATLTTANVTYMIATASSGVPAHATVKLVTAGPTTALSLATQGTAGTHSDTPGSCELLSPTFTAFAPSSTQYAVVQISPGSGSTIDTIYNVKYSYTETRATGT